MIVHQWSTHGDWNPAASTVYWMVPGGAPLAEVSPDIPTMLIPNEAGTSRYGCTSSAQGSGATAANPTTAILIALVKDPNGTPTVMNSPSNVTFQATPWASSGGTFFDQTQALSRFAVNDRYGIRLTTPAWTTPPTGLAIDIQIYFNLRLSERVAELLEWVEGFQPFGGNPFRDVSEIPGGGLS
jgi:hypothetical protein